jgi:cytoskeleton protein RodZ
MSRRKSRVKSQGNWSVRAADPGQHDLLPIPESESVSSEGIEDQDLQASSEDIRTEPDSATVLNLTAEDSTVDVDDPASVGMRLRAAREQRGWSCEEVASRLKLQARLIRRIEDDDYSGIAHAVYLRGYLTSYARLLDMPLILAERVVAERGESAPLQSTGRVSRSRYMLDRYSVSATYLILTALVVGPAVWLATHGGLEQNLARTVMLDGPAVTQDVSIPGLRNDAPGTASMPGPVSDSAGPLASTTSVSSAEADEPASPIIASMAPFSSSQPALTGAPSASATTVAGKHDLVLTLSEPSWVEVTAGNGEKLEYGLLDAGVVRHYSSDSMITVRLGNAKGAAIVADGKPIDLVPFRRANVAHLRIFGSGELASRADF